MWYPLATGWTPWTRNLATKDISVPASGETTLTFMTRYDFGKPGIGWYSGSYGPDYDPDRPYADGYIEASSDNGATWQPLTGTVAGVSRSVLASMTTSGEKWVPASYDLSAYAGQAIKVRFRMETWSSGYGYGHWGVDNIGIANSASGSLLFDDVETQNPIWENSYWTRSIGAIVGMGGDAWGY